MADEATFKNPGVQTLHDYWAVGAESQSFESFTFDKEEFDMLVTFTRKPPKIKVGDEVRHDDYNFIWKVLAIYQDRAWLIAINPLFGTVPSTRWLSDLRPA